MGSWIQELADRLVRPESRRLELASVRLQLLANPGPEELTREELRLGRELRGLRLGLIAAFGELEACRTCARGHALPRGRWDGGYCCGTTTERLFTLDEIAALRAGGTEPRDLRPPRGDHAGCAFRGKRGCSLALEHRPGICVRHVCPALAEELRARGDYEQIRRMSRRMLEVFDEFREGRRLTDNSPAVSARAFGRRRGMPRQSPVVGQGGPQSQGPQLVPCWPQV